MLAPLSAPSCTASIKRTLFSLVFFSLSSSLCLQDSFLIFNIYRAYEIPSDLFQIPTGYVWIFTARLVTGKGLPPMAAEWAIGAAILFAAVTLVRIRTAEKSWQAYIPGGIAVAIGKYSDQLARPTVVFPLF